MSRQTNTNREHFESLNMRSVDFGTILDRSYDLSYKCEDYNVPIVNSQTCDISLSPYVIEKGSRDTVDVERRFMFEDQNEDYQDFVCSQFAFNQLCAKIGVPSSYIDKCLGAKMFSLAEENVKSWLSLYGKDLFVRTYDDRIRGILSGRFSVCDTHVILDSILDSGFPVEDYNIKGFFLDENFFHVRFVSKNKLPIDDEDLFIGVTISSSDVGRSNLIASMFVWKQVCTNGLIIPKSAGTLYRQKHLGLTAEEFQTEFTNSLQYIPSLTKGIIDHINEAQNNALDPKIFLEEANFNKFIDSVKSSTNLSEEDSKKVANLMIDGTYPKTKFGLINSITQVAQDFTLTRRIELERIAGELLLAA